MRLEAGKIFKIHRQAAAGGDDDFYAAGKFPDGFFFKCAKSWFAIPGENVRYTAARFGLDQFIRIEVFKAQLVGDEAANGRLARAHETDERDVDEMTVVVHTFEIANFALLDNF